MQIIDPADTTVCNNRDLKRQINAWPDICPCNLPHYLCIVLKVIHVQKVLFMISCHITNRSLWKKRLNHYIILHNSLNFNFSEKIKGWHELCIDRQNTTCLRYLWQILYIGDWFVLNPKIPCLLSYTFFKANIL